MTSDYGYVLIAPCGCLRAAVVEDEDRQRRLGERERFAREAVQRGYRLERWTGDRIRTQSWRCDSTNCPFHGTTQWSSRQEALFL